MDKHLIFYVMFFPTVVFFLWGMAQHLSIWLEGSIKGEEKATKWEKLKILTRRGWEGFRARPGWYVKIVFTDVIFHRKLFIQSFFRWFAHTLMVFGFAATFVVDTIKGFTTGYLVEFGLQFAHEFETGALRPLLDFSLDSFGL